MEHVSKTGESKFVEHCSLPLTGQGCVDMVVTDLCVLSRKAKGQPFQIIELADGVSFDEVRRLVPASVQSALTTKAA
jgi:acyl CoA:acetate/3-ketoacid CoA transferase beta subunit